MGASGPERGTAGSKAALTAGVIVWAAVVAGGLKLVADYKTTAGAARPAPARWPRESRLEPASGRETLVIFVHPKCACTRASLTELNIIINASAARARTIVVFLRPVGVEGGWERTDTWDYAATIPGATRFVDDGGVEAQRFGADTSGHVVLYDAGENLQFSGGITGSRGHAGDNVGRRIVLARLEARPADEDRHPVYGCPFADPSPGASGAERGPR